MSYQEIELDGGEFKDVHTRSIPKVPIKPTNIAMCVWMIVYWLVITVIVSSFLLPALVIPLFSYNSLLSLNSPALSSVIGDPMRSVFHTRSQIPPNTTLAFVGDLTMGYPTGQLYNLIREEGAQALVLGGDLSYVHSPAAWEKQINHHLGADFPLFVVMGNHDNDAQWEEYSERIRARWQRNGQIDSCTGIPGIKHICVFKGIPIIQLAYGTLVQDLTTDWIAEARALLEQSRNISDWTLINWHKNGALLQPSPNNIDDSVGNEMFDLARSYGALAITHHSHTYSRTKYMSSVNNHTLCNASYVQNRCIFVTTIGTGGEQIDIGDNTLIHAPWMETSVVAETLPHAHAMALFCTFHYNNEPDNMYCWVKDITGHVFDSFHAK
jgi:hypothetical protein